MDASNWIAIGSILVTPITAWAAYWWGRRDKRHAQKLEHDKEVFVRLDIALSYPDLKEFLENLDEGYFFRGAGTKVAEFQTLIREPENTFLQSTLQGKIQALSSSLRSLRAYTGENFSTKESDRERVWLHPEKKVAARRELLPLIDAAEQRYKEFRAAIKHELAV